jgi:hypothetical protein
MASLEFYEGFGEAMTVKEILWTEGIEERVIGFLRELRIEGKTGKYRPCLKGIRKGTQDIALGFSCMALKITHTLGLWEKLSSKEKNTWIAYIQSFQVSEPAFRQRVSSGAFIDTAQVSVLMSQMPWYKRFLEVVPTKKSWTTVDKLIIAETKQAIATLAQVGARAVNPYRGFPTTPGEITLFLSQLDWSKPWSAGGQAAAMAVFLKTEGPRFLAPVQVKALKGMLARFLEGKADAKTGAYFKGKIPEHGQLVNGAMKVLTALDWLELPIPYPERLIDTCLRRLPPPEGCHLVDWVYVLYRSSRQSPYRIHDIQAQSNVILEMIRCHHNNDGGFSSRVGKSKTHYYGARISEGFPGSDVVGTALLTWAMAMIFRLLNDHKQWNVIRP